MPYLLLFVEKFLYTSIFLLGALSKIAIEQAVPVLSLPLDTVLLIDLEVVFSEIDVLILIIIVFTPISLYFEDSSAERIVFMSYFEHPEARLKSEHCCKSLLAFRRVQKAVEILFKIPLILHIEFVLRIFLSQPDLFTILADHHILPQIFHNIIAVVQDHLLPNLI